jgi:hypothetical protein
MTIKERFNAFMNPSVPKPMESYQSFDMLFGTSKYNKSLPRELINSRYVWFGDDNLYPNRLNDLYESSPLHSAIIDFKKLMVCGQGYTLDDSGLNGFEKVALANIKNEISDEESLKSFIENITQDLLIHATIYVKLCWNADKTKLISAERIEPSKMRLGYNKQNPDKIDKYYYSFDWRDTGRFPIREYLPKSKNTNNKIEILRVIKRSNSLLFYTAPSYVAATNWLELDARIPLFHKSNIENSTNPSKAIFFYQKPANDEAKREIMNQFQKSYTGEETTGKSMLFFVDGKENKPDIETIEPNQLDKQFKETAGEASRNICYAHRINPLILGLKQEGGSMGNPKELLNAYEIFKVDVINPIKNDIEEVVNQIIGYYGVKAKFTLNDVELFSEERKSNEK